MSALIPNAPNPRRRSPSSRGVFLTISAKRFLFFTRPGEHFCKTSCASGNWRKGSSVFLFPADTADGVRSPAFYARSSSNMGPTVARMAALVNAWTCCSSCSVRARSRHSPARESLSPGASTPFSAVAFLEVEAQELVRSTSSRARARSDGRENCGIWFLSRRLPRISVPRDSALGFRPVRPTLKKRLGDRASGWATANFTVTSEIRTSFVANLPERLGTVLSLLKTWAQNGRETSAFRAQIEGCEVSKGSRINRNFAELWSGRWESNPRPKLGKLLYCHCTTPAHLSRCSIIHKRVPALTSTYCYHQESTWSDGMTDARDG